MKTLSVKNNIANIEIPASNLANRLTIINSVFNSQYESGNSWNTVDELISEFILNNSYISNAAAAGALGLGKPYYNTTTKVITLTE